MWGDVQVLHSEAAPGKRMWHRLKKWEDNLPLHYYTLGLQVPSEKVFRVGLEGPDTEPEEVLRAS